MTVLDRIKQLRPVLVLAALAVFAFFWFGGGEVQRSQSTSEVAAQERPDSAEDSPMLVQVVRQQASPVRMEIVLQGHTEHDRTVVVRSETSGRVSEILVPLGALVSAGDPVVRLAMDDRETQLRRARASLRQHQRNHEALLALQDDGYLAESRLNEAQTKLEEARVELAVIERDIANTELRAPFDGIIDHREVEIGDFVAIRDDIFTIVDNDPLLVSVDVPQQQRGAVQKGDNAWVGLITGQQAEGRVRFVSTTGDAATRTFHTEIEISNPDRVLPAGVSAEARLIAGEAVGHLVSPAWFVRNPDNDLGLYTVNDSNRIVFYPVSIVRADTSGVWVSGLPSSASIVAAGQGYVSEGEQVRVSDDAVQTGQVNAQGASATGVALPL